MVARSEQISVERRQVGYEAHAEDDAKAKAKLDKLNAEFASLAGTIDSIDGALAEARNRLDQAKRDEAAMQDRKQAGRLRAELKNFVEQGRQLDAAFATVAAAGAAIRDSLSRIHALGSAVPSHEQLQTLGGQAALTALQQTPWARRFELLPPNQRRTFAALIGGWVENIERNNIRPRLGEQTKEEAA